MIQHRIRTLIVDDEPLARALLRSFLAEDAEIEVVGECGDGYSAIEMIDSAAPERVVIVAERGVDAAALFRAALDGLARHAADEAPAFQGDDHRMDTRGRDLKVPLHVGFGRSATVHHAVLMDVGQELALAFGGGCVHARRPPAAGRRRFPPGIR